MSTYTEFCDAMGTSLLRFIPDELKNNSTEISKAGHSIFVYLNPETKESVIESISWLTDVAEKDNQDRVGVGKVKSFEEVQVSTWVSSSDGYEVCIMVHVPEHIFNEIFEPRVEQIFKEVVVPVKLLRFFLVNMPEVSK